MNAARHVPRHLPIHKAFVGCVKKHSLLPFPISHVKNNQPAAQPATTPREKQGTVMADAELSAGWTSFPAQLYFTFFPIS